MEVVVMARGRERAAEEVLPATVTSKAADWRGSGSVNFRLTPPGPPFLHVYLISYMCCAGRLVTWFLYSWSWCRCRL